MSKVLVDRELLVRLENAYMEGMSIYGECEEIRAILAQPAEAEGVRDYLTEFAEGEVEAKTAIEELQDALSAVTAERDRLRASKLYWVAPAGSGLVRCVTDERYRKFSPSIRAKYDPVCCVDATMSAKDA